MSRWPSIFILVLVIFVGSQVYATPRTALDQKIYADMLSLCRADDSVMTAGARFRDSMSVTYDQFNKVIFSFDEVTARSVWRDRGYSPMMAAILESQGLVDAMTECYPNAVDKREQFVLSLIIADTAGRAAGGAQGALTIFLGTKVFKKFVNVTYKLLGRTKFGKRLNPAYEKTYKSLIGFFIVGGLMAPTISDLIDAKELSDARDEEMVLKNSKMIMQGAEAIESLEQEKLASFGVDRCYILRTQQELVRLVLGFYKRIESLDNISEDVLNVISRARSLQSETCH